MSERCVEIPVRREIRDGIKKEKGNLSYNSFFELVLMSKIK